MKTKTKPGYLTLKRVSRPTKVMVEECLSQSKRLWLYTRSYLLLLSGENKWEHRAQGAFRHIFSKYIKRALNAPSSIT